MPLFIPITKVNVAQRLVHGTLSEEIPDKTGEILDYASAKPAFQEWSRQFEEASGGKSLGNVRAMHGNIAAGKLTDIHYDDENKRIEGVAKVVDEDAWQKVLEGVYTGFSIGGGYTKRWQDTENPALMRYTPSLSEVSLVDNPAVPTATFSVIKHDGSTELRRFVAPMQKAEPSTDTLRECLQWLEKQEPDETVLEHVLAMLEYLSQDDASVEKGMRNTQNHTVLYKQFYDSVETLSSRIAQLEAMPVAARGNLKSLQKSHDYVDFISDAPNLA